MVKPVLLAVIMHVVQLQNWMNVVYVMVVDQVKNVGMAVMNVMPVFAQIQAVSHTMFIVMVNFS